MSTAQFVVGYATLVALAACVLISVLMKVGGPIRESWGQVAATRIAYGIAAYVGLAVSCWALYWLLWLAIILRSALMWVIEAMFFLPLWLS